jgi:hypothetical protein
VLLLPSGRRVVVQRLRRDDLVCCYETPLPCDRRISVKICEHDLQLTRRFCARYARAVPA